jgi:hypothetical protein
MNPFKLVAALTPEILGEMDPISGAEPVDMQFARAAIVIELIGQAQVKQGILAWSWVVDSLRLIW